MQGRRPWPDVSHRKSPRVRDIVESKLVYFNGPPLRPVDAMRPRMSDATVSNRFLWIPMRCAGRLRELARVVPWL